MTNVFAKGPSRYGTPTPPSSPYQRARQVWDDRVGSAAVHARNWRLVAVGCLGLNAALLTAYVLERRGSHVAAYVVPINEYGRPGRIERLGASYNPSAAEQGYFVAEWIRLIRSKPKDAVVLKENWLRAYDFVAPEAVAALDAEAKAQNVFHNVGVSATLVSVASIIPRGPHSFQVSWRETRSDGANTETKENWTALVTVALRPPASESDLRKNPLGVFVTAFQVAREL